MRWMMRQCGDYARLGFFAAALLLGLQIPAFVEQYEQRVDASLIEAKTNLAGFNFTADRYFDGDIKKLIAHYRASNDEVFQQDANSVESIVSRVSYLNEEAASLQGSPLLKAYHVLKSMHTPLFQETLNAYAFVVPLNAFSLMWGAGLAVFLVLLLDISLTCGKSVLRRKSKTSKIPRPHKT
jgi:hypothetical protein